MNLKETFNWQNLFKNRTPEGGFAPSGELTPEQAIKVFDVLAKMEDITHGYIGNGCQARTHLMCERLLMVGLTPQKSWALATHDKPLVVQKPDMQKQSWLFYHVAPTLPVKKKDGHVEQMVFDPSLFDGPASVSEWSQSINASSGRVTVEPLGTPPFNEKGDYDLVRSSTGINISLDAKLTMKRYQKWNQVGYKPPFKSTLRTKLLSENIQDPGIAFLRNKNEGK